MKAVGHPLRWSSGDGDVRNGATVGGTASKALVRRRIRPGGGEVWRNQPKAAWPNGNAAAGSMATMLRVWWTCRLEGVSETCFWG